MSQEAGGQPGSEQQHVPRPVHTSQHPPAPSEAISVNGAAGGVAGASSSKRQPKAEKKSKKGDDLATTMSALEVRRRIPCLLAVRLAETL